MTDQPKTYDELVAINDWKVAQANLYYDHAQRKISIEKGEDITIEQAKDLFDKALVADCNMALTTLANNDWDMDAVETYYNECDKYS